MEKDYKEEKKQEKSDKLKNVLLVILLILLCILFDKSQVKSEAKLDNNLMLEESAVAWTGDKKFRKNDASQDTLSLPGFKSMTLEANTHLVDVNLHNPDNNKAYMVLRLILSESDEILYESNLIQPGKGLYQIHLKRPLDEGHYKAKIHYEPYDLISLKRLNGAIMNFELIAKIYDD